MALKDIAGQKRALRIFFGTLRRDRAPSALLLSGDQGIGKRLAALNYAKALNCLKPVGFDCCDACPSCRKIDAEMHPDITVFSPDGDEIKIDAVRKIEEVLFLKPFEGRRKVVIIDDADAMNINAANAFLKTLEEPPEDSVIVLITSNPDGLPDTVRSRCTHIRFYPLPVEEFNKVVSRNIGGGDMDFVRKLSMGRPGLALSGDFANEREWFMKLLSSMTAGGARDAWADKSAIRSWLDMSFILLRDMAVFKVTGSEDDLMWSGRTQWTSRDISLKAVFEAYQDLQALRRLLDFNLNKSISWNYVSAIMQNLK